MWRIDEENPQYQDALYKSRVGYSESHSRIPAIAVAAGMESEELPSAFPLIKFRTCDDDDNWWYKGILHDDDECLNQEAALNFARDDVGATIIEVYRDGEWVQEIE